LRILLNAAQTLNAVLDVNHILRELTSRVRELANAAGGTAGIVENGKLIFREYNSLGQLRPINLEFMPGESVPGFVFQTTKPYFSNNAETDPYVKPELRKEFGFYDLINIPILSRSGVLIADVELHNSKDGRGFSDRDFPMLQGLADIAAVALENAMLLEQRRSAEFESERANRELDSKNKELESIIFVASHDLRSALVNVQGFSKELSMSCEVLRSKLTQVQISPDAKDDVDRMIEQDIPESLTFILDSTGTIDSLLSGLLRLSRIGREPITITDVDMNALIAHAIKSLEFQIMQARARIDVENLSPCRGDYAQLTTVFTNLLDNAIKFLDHDRQGHIKISGKIDNGSVLYCVEDNGIGIAPEHQSRIFEVFHRLYPERTIGEGLGLTIARRIIERHNGRIWVESQPGKGSKFFVLLPAAGNA
jgi:signal transduction histidine kinase